MPTRKEPGDTGPSRFGGGKGCGVQQCGANAAAMMCGGHMTDAALQQLHPRHRSDGARLTTIREDQQTSARRLNRRVTRDVFQQVTAATGRSLATWAARWSLHYARGFLKGAARTARP